MLHTMRMRRFFLVYWALYHDALAISRSRSETEEQSLYITETRQQRRLLLGPTRASDKTRAEALAQSAKVVHEVNAAYKAGTKSYFLGYNALSDVTDEEYRAFLASRPDKRAVYRKQQTQDHGRKGTSGKQMTSSFALDSGPKDSNDEQTSRDVLTEVDWTTKDGGKYLTPIKNQGTCGSCWAFAGVSVLEARFAIEHHVHASVLSVEQVLSCSAPLDHIQSKFDDNMTSSSKGCAGGMPFLTYAYLDFVKPHGIACEDTYPYVMATNETETQCLAVDATKVAVAWEENVSDYKVVAANEQALLRAVTLGPVTANMDATGDGFRHYAGGIYDARDCRSDGVEVNHAVVVVGFGQRDTGEQFWIIRNTWGTMWGEDGYMRIARGSNVSAYGPCNLYLYATYPVNLTGGSNSTSGEPACAVSKLVFEPLPLMELLGLSGNQIALLVLATVLSVIAGMALYHGTELMQNRKKGAGNLSYQDCYARWVLPSRDQIAAALTQRNIRRTQRTTS